MSVAAEVALDEFAGRVVAEHGRKGHARAGAGEMLGDDAGAADEILLLLEAHAHGRRLGAAADHGAARIGVDDGVADDVDAQVVEAVEHAAQAVEIEVLGIEQRQELFGRDRGRRGLDDVRGREHDVAGREDHLAAIGLDRVLLLGGARMQPGRGVFVTLGEDVGLDQADVVDRRRLRVDHHVVDRLERGEIEGAQLLRHEGAEIRFQDMRVRRQARDQNVALALGVEQMADMAGMHDVERAVAHDDLAGARTAADQRGDLGRALQLVAHHPMRRIVHHAGAPLAARALNHADVAAAMESGFQSGASRQ